MSALLTFQEATVSDLQFFWNNMSVSDILLKFSQRPTERQSKKRGMSWKVVMMIATVKFG